MAMIKRLIRKLGEVNFYADTETLRQDDEEELRDQILSTRLYIVLMVTSIWILLISISLTERTTTIVVPKPSIDMYERLQAAYSTTLLCPCRQIAIPYSTFLSIEPTLHQVSNNILGVS